jgi:hypothetical protein
VIRLLPEPRLAAALDPHRPPVCTSVP